MLHFAVLHPSRYHAKNSPETVETHMVNSIWSFKFLAESVVMHMDGFSLILAWLEVKGGISGFLDPQKRHWRGHFGDSKSTMATRGAELTEIMRVKLRDQLRPTECLIHHPSSILI
jgi:hypothetical protein